MKGIPAIVPRRRSCALFALAALGFPGCAPNLAGIPCKSDDNCPTGQYCNSGHCRSGNDLQGVVVTPDSPSIAQGAVQSFVATGIYSDSSTADLTSRVKWTSANESVATVSNGLAAGLTLGVTTISATAMNAAGAPVTGSTPLIVGPAALSVTPANPTIAVQTSLQFEATGLLLDGTTVDLTPLARWESSATSVATVANPPAGLATGHSSGATAIKATVSGVSGFAMLTVTNAAIASLGITPQAPTIGVGTTEQFYARGVFSDGSSQDVTALATWTSSDASVATLSNEAGFAGLATAIRGGTTNVAAAFGGKAGSTLLTVTPATLTSVVLAPPNDSIPAATDQQFTATGVYSDGTTQNLTSLATWSSSDANVATISNTQKSKGLATGLAMGSATISAAFGGLDGATTLNVTAGVLTSIAVSPLNAQLAAGATLQFTAVGSYSDGLTHNITTLVTWSSSSPRVASVSNAGDTKGLASATQTGTSSISATAPGTNISGAASLLVQ